MNAAVAGFAAMVLFGGQNLDGWIALSGAWDVKDAAMVCADAPAVIRSAFESDGYELTFQYRQAGEGENRLWIHSKMSAGGTPLLLTAAGLAKEGKTSFHSQVPDEDWISVKLTVTERSIQAVSARSDGAALSEFKLPLEAPSRGFLRFHCTRPGLQIRQVVAVEPGFTPLFDGQTLDGWEIVRPKDADKPGWVAENGTIKCIPRRSSWLRTLRTYDNLVLRLEYRLPPRGNSGIFLRAPIEGRVSRIGLEFQLLDDAAFKGKIKPAQFTGSVYDGIPPEISVPCPPDQWNAIEILADGPHIRTILNSVQLYDARLSDKDKDTNAHTRPLATRRTVGFLGLQDHAASVLFRNLRIKELPRR